MENYNKTFSVSKKANAKKSAQNLQDEIFKKMTIEKKINLTSELTAFCLELNKLR